MFSVLVLLTLQAIPSVPRHHKIDLHHEWQLSLLFYNSKQSSGMCQFSLLQLEQYCPSFPLLSSGPPPPPPFLLPFDSVVRAFTFIVRRELVSVMVETVLVRAALHFTN